MNKQQKGLVYKSTGSWYDLRSEDGRFWKARLKGKFRSDDEISSTNPIAIGDWVSFTPEQEEGNLAMIEEIAKRDNYIVRVSPHNKHQRHILASNLDMAFVICSIASPRTSQGFIDRFLVTAEAYHIPVVIVFNKSDLLKEKDRIKLEHWSYMYRDIGYKVLVTSALEENGYQQISEVLYGNTALFCGHSGVGKSTIINTLLPEHRQKVNIVSAWSGKGQHTTTFAEMFDVPDLNAKIIDTPGVKELGIIEMGKSELSHYFPEMRSELAHCKFNNCSHVHEPGCAVTEAVAEGKIDELRYISYLNILESL